MPRVITEALAEPDVIATFLVLVVISVVIAWVLFRPEGGRFFQRAGATP